MIFFYMILGILTSLGFFISLYDFVKRNTNAINSFLYCIILLILFIGNSLMFKLYNMEREILTLLDIVRQEQIMLSDVDQDVDHLQGGLQSLNRELLEFETEVDSLIHIIPGVPPAPKD